MEKTMLSGMSERAVRLAREKHLEPLQVLYGDYVVLCRDATGRKVVLKTDNMQREVEIYEVLIKHFDPKRWLSLDLVRFLDYSDDYIVMKYVEGIDPNREILDGERDVMRFRYFPLMVRGFWDLKDFLAQAAKNVTAIDIEMTKPGEPTVYEWLRIKPMKWAQVAQEKDHAKTLLQPSITDILGKALRAQAGNPTFQRQLVPQFGVYGPHQMIIREGRVVLFDFGGHLKWRPELYDAVWPLWWQLLHLTEEWLEPERREDVKRYVAVYQDSFWSAAPGEYQRKVRREGFDALFLAVLVERLIGCHIDILRRPDNHLREQSDTYVGKLAKMVGDLLIHYAGELKALPY